MGRPSFDSVPCSHAWAAFLGKVRKSTSGVATCGSACSHAWVDFLGNYNKSVVGVTTWVDFLGKPKNVCSVRPPVGLGWDRRLVRIR